MINIILQMGEVNTRTRERLVQSYTRSDPSGRTRGEVVTNDVCLVAYGKDGVELRTSH